MFCVYKINRDLDETQKGLDFCGSRFQTCVPGHVSVLPCPGRPGDSVDGDLVTHQLPRRNLEHLSLISSCGHLHTHKGDILTLNQHVCVCVYLYVFCVYTV